MSVVYGYFTQRSPKFTVKGSKRFVYVYLKGSVKYILVKGEKKPMKLTFCLVRSKRGSARNHRAFCSQRNAFWLKGAEAMKIVFLSLQGHTK